MTKNEYIKSLIYAFNTCKKIIKEGKVEIIIDFEKEDNAKNLICTIPDFKKIPKIKIYSISIDTYLQSKFIPLSGVNVLFYIVALYLRIEKNNKGIYNKYKNPESERTKMKERTEILKKTSFIFERHDTGFWYYSVSELKNTSLFIFDIKKMDGDTTPNN